MAGATAKELVAVADASFLIGLSRIGQWKLLEGMTDKVYVPRAVWDEVVEQGQGRPGVRELQSGPIIQRRSVNNAQAAEMLKVFLGAGEAEALILAQELGNATVLLDDLRARRAARQAGLRTIGLVGFLVAAKNAGLVDEVRPLLAALEAQGFRLGQAR